jgi:hypothetical protein
MALDSILLMIGGSRVFTDISCFIGAMSQLIADSPFVGKLMFVIVLTLLWQYCNISYIHSRLGRNNKILKHIK